MREACLPIFPWFQSYEKYIFFLFVGVAGHGQHLTGLGHVQDLARAMANVLGKEVAKGQVYNVQVRLSEIKGFCRGLDGY